MIVALGCAACSDADDGQGPTISALTYSPKNMAVGQSNTISGTMLFADPDGDLDELAASILLPSGARQDIAPTKIQSVAGMKSGPLSWSMLIRPPVAGTYSLDLHVEDAAGHASNTMTAVITAQ